MAAYFFDSSALVKRYLSEAGSGRVIGLTDPAAGHRIYVSRITGVELVSALVRQARAGNLTRDVLSASLTELLRNFAACTGQCRLRAP